MPANPVFGQSNPLPLPFAMGSRFLPALRLPSITITPPLPIRAVFFKYSEKSTLFLAHPSLMLSFSQVPIGGQREPPLRRAWWPGARDGPYPATVHQVVLKACLKLVDGFRQRGHGGGFQKLPKDPILLKWVSLETRSQWHQAGAHLNALPAGFVDIAEMRMCNLLGSSHMEELIPGYSHRVILPRDVFMYVMRLRLL